MNDIDTNNISYILAHPENVYDVKFTRGYIRTYSTNLHTNKSTPLEDWWNQIPTIVISAFDTTDNTLDDNKSTPTVSYHVYQVDSFSVNSYFPGIEQYNKLLSLVEDCVSMPIEEFTHGIFVYLV